MKTTQIVLLPLVLLPVAAQPVATAAQHEMHTGPPPAQVSFPAGKDVVEVPFQLVHEKILISVGVNGSEPMPFVLDTGAPIAVLMRSEKASALDLDIVGKAAVGGAGEGEASMVDLAANVTFQLQDITITGSTMAIGVGEGKLPQMGWEGVIGRPLFKNLVVDLDFANEVMRLYPPDKFRYKGTGSEIPITIAPGSGFAFVESEVSIDGKKAVPATLAIDTGAGHALSLSVDAHDELDAPEKTVSSILHWGANGVIRGRTGRISSLKVGDFVMRDVVASFPNPEGTHALASMGAFGDITRHGILGAKVLKRFRVIFDYTNARMILEPTKGLDAPFASNNSGLRPWPWAPGDAFVKVADIVASSPAEEAGLEVGDRIIAIDGRSVEGLAPDRIEEFLEQAPGTRVKLTVMRGEKKFDRELVLRQMI